MKCFEPRIIRNSESAIANGWPHYIQVPCGKCPACLKRRRSNWAERARRELIEFYYNSYKPFRGDEKDCNLAFLLTLTYDNRKIPVEQPTDDCELVYQSLRYSDVTDLFHTLNKRRFRNGLPPPSTLICGEYGPKTNRPHYHCLVIGISLYDIRQMRILWEQSHAPLSFIFEKYSITRSRFGTNEYKGVGFKATEIYMSSIQSLMGCAKYVAKYVVKQHKTNYDFPWIVKPRVNVSKNFGLGTRFRVPASKSAQSSFFSKKMLDYKNLFLSSPCKTEIDGFYNPEYLRVLNSRFVSKDNGGYFHAMPPYLRNKFFPRGKEIIVDNNGNKTEKSLYCSFEPDISQIPISVPLCDALCMVRDSDLRCKNRSAIASIVADGTVNELEAASILECEELRSDRLSGADFLQQYYSNEYELMCGDEF